MEWCEARPRFGYEMIESRILTLQWSLLSPCLLSASWQPSLLQLWWSLTFSGDAVNKGAERCLRHIGELREHSH